MCISQFQNCTDGAKDPPSSRRRFIQRFPKEGVRHGKGYCDKNKTNIRKLTPNECRKLQGFPSDWKQVVSDTQAYKQFGNAVTINVIYAVAKELFDYIEKNKIGEW